MGDIYRCENALDANRGEKKMANATGSINYCDRHSNYYDRPHKCCCDENQRVVTDAATK